MGEFAVGPVELAPLVEQRQDLLGLLGQQPVHRGPARRLVGQLAAGSSGDPAVCPPLRQLHAPARPAQGPARLQGLIKQVQQGGLGGRADRVRDPATQPQPPFPSTSISLTAISFRASDSRATSALASSSS